MKAHYKLVATLKEPEGTWENKLDVTFDKPEAALGFSIQRIAKIVGEHGIVETSPTEDGGLRTRFIPYERIVELNSSIDPVLIDDSTDVQAAEAEAERSAKIKEALTRGVVSFPGKNGPN